MAIRDARVKLFDLQEEDTQPTCRTVAARSKRSGISVYKGDIT